MMDAHVMSVSLTCGSRSWSRQCRRALMIHESDLSTTQRRGSTMKPDVFGDRRTVLIVTSRRVFAQVTRAPS
ncbi:hypothetical protein UK15_37185 [Streptomyces variegatus]|uniref:Uncharacterized protein n=1 Tax=Streptomyces variegatus TaxID=284040 RepID=A0A0M2GCD4_9ACTN|nr:hypothetical protein UK15_37185 [Streptomyces variegatus]